MRKTLFALTIFLPLLILVPLQAIFLVRPSIIPAENGFMRSLILGNHSPIYAIYPHALASLRLIVVVGVILCVAVSGLEMLLRAKHLTLHTVAAFLVGFITWLSVGHSEWLRPVNKPPFWPVLINSGTLGILYAAITLVFAAGIRDFKRQERD